MRKVRDFDAELKTLSDKARILKARKVQQLGELVAATGADALDPETLAGVLLEAIATRDAGIKEAWRANGAAFFQNRRRRLAKAAGGNSAGAEAQPGSDLAR